MAENRRQNGVLYALPQAQAKAMQPRKQKQNQPSSRIKVVVRLRPRIPEDASSERWMLRHGAAGEDSIKLEPSDSTALHLRKEFHETRYFNFDRVLAPAVSQEGMYAEVRSIVHDSLNGFNTTVLAYGQTGTGKTHTIFGGDEAYWNDPVTGLSTSQTLHPLRNHNDKQNARNVALPACCGIVPRAVQQIFTHVDDCQRRGNQITVTMSFLQIYMEEVTDLLAPIMSPESAGQKLVIREDPKHGIFVEGLNHMILDGDPAESSALVLRAVKAAVTERATSSTAQNSHSSRSHALLQFTIQQYGDDDDKNSAEPGQKQRSKTRLKRSVLSIVDLAGSERVSKSGSEGLRLEEAKKINRSISALGNCVSALASMQTQDGPDASTSSSCGQSSGGGGGHVPFRDSKLTRLLTNSLGGNSKTCVCATVGPAPGSYEETHSTLLFSRRAMAVRNRAVVNEHLVTAHRAHESLRSPPRGSPPPCTRQHQHQLYAGVLQPPPPPPQGGLPPHCHRAGAGSVPGRDTFLTEAQWAAREAELTQHHARVVDKLQRELAVQNLTIAKLHQQLRAVGGGAPAANSNGTGTSVDVQQQQHRPQGRTQDSKIGKIAESLLVVPELRAALLKNLRTGQGT